MASRLLSVVFAAFSMAAAFSSFSNAPSSSSEFSMAMVHDGSNLTLVAIDSGQAGTVSIVGMDPVSYAGTPVMQNGTSGSASLSFDIGEDVDYESRQTGRFGIFVPDLGELYGQQYPITATSGEAWPHFYVGSGYVDAQRTAASQQWYACGLMVQGKDYIGLSWGVYNSNGSSPFGCQPRIVYQNFNIRCDP